MINNLTRSNPPSIITTRLSRNLLSLIKPICSIYIYIYIDIDIYVYVMWWLWSDEGILYSCIIFLFLWNKFELFSLGRSFMGRDFKIYRFMEKMLLPFVLKDSQFNSIISIIYWLDIIESGLAVLFLSLEFRLRLHDEEENDDGSETPPLENHINQISMWHITN